MIRKLCVLLILAFCALPLLAQQGPPANLNAPSSMRPMGRGNSQPCLQKAGVDRSAMEQLMSLQRELHAQVQSVCSNSSLTPQQKHQQVEEIRQQAHQKMEGLITPEQQKALLECRQEQQGGGHPGNGGGLLMGGCGEWQPGGAHPGTGAAPGAGNGSGNPPAAHPAPSQN